MTDEAAAPAPEAPQRVVLVFTASVGAYQIAQRVSDPDVISMVRARPDLAPYYVEVPVDEHGKPLEVVEEAERAQAKVDANEETARRHIEEHANAHAHEADAGADET